MTQSRIPRLIVSLSVPTVISMLISSIYNLADTFFVSNLGAAQSGAVSIVFSLMSIIQAIGFGLGLGSGSLISRHLGKKEEERASVFASSAFAAALLFGGIVVLFGSLFIEPLMQLLGARADILSHSISYGRYIIYGAPVMCASFVMNNILRAEGKALFSMIGLSVGGLFNIALDPLFIYTFGLGTAGAAIATLISQAISFAVLFFFFLSGKSIVKIKLRSISRKAADYGNIIKTGSPTILRQGLASFSTALLNRIAGSITDSAQINEACVAAMGIVNKIYLFARSSIIGIGQGYQPVAGYNYGAEKFSRVRKAFFFTTLLGTIICTVTAGALALFAEPIMTFFIKDTDPEKMREVIRIGKTALWFICAALPFMAYTTYADQTLQCLGKSGSAGFLASCRQGIFFLPLIYLLSAYFGITGIALTQPLADILTLIITIPFQVRFFSSLKKKEDGTYKHNKGETDGLPA